MRFLFALVLSISFLTSCSEQEKIVYVSSNGTITHLYEMNLDGSEVRKLSDGYEQEWAPTNYSEFEITFLREVNPGEVVRIKRNMRTGGESLLLQPPECMLDDKNIQYSDDRTIELFECNGNIYVRYVLSRYTDILTAQIPGESFNATWFPDYQRIAFTNRSDVFNNIYVMDIETKQYDSLTEAFDFNAEAPEISPDGKFMLFSANRESLNNYDIYTMDLESLALRNISNTPGWELVGRWSPDGSKIIYGSNLNNDWELFMFDFETERTTRLTRRDEFDGDPRFVKY